MTITNTAENLRILGLHGIRAARSKDVDSAEDAVAFAERRDARDPRFMPVVLRAAEGSTSAVLHSEDALRRAYGALAAGMTSPRIFIQEAVAPGTDVEIVGRTDAPHHKVIVLQAGSHAAERMVPLGDDGAEWLAANYLDHHHHGKSEKQRRMLAHLLLRASQFFEVTGVPGFRFAVRLHENGYTVVDATMSGRDLRESDRHVAHAHDRQTEPEYRPSGHQ